MQDHRDEREPEDLDDLPDSWHELPDPWDGDHNIEYWVWDGVRLVPTTPEERARIREDERTQAARRRLMQLQERERHQARKAFVMRRLSSAQAWWTSRVRIMTHQLPKLQGLQSRWRQGQGPRLEGTRAERPSTKR